MHIFGIVTVTPMYIEGETKEGFEESAITLRILRFFPRNTHASKKSQNTSQVKPQGG